MIDRFRIATNAALEVQSVDVVMIPMALEGKFGVHISVDGRLAEAVHRNDCIKNSTGPFIEERTSRAT